MHKIDQHVSQWECIKNPLTPEKIKKVRINFNEINEFAPVSMSFLFYWFKMQNPEAAKMQTQLEIQPSGYHLIMYNNEIRILFEQKMLYDFFDDNNLHIFLNWTKEKKFIYSIRSKHSDAFKEFPEEFTSRELCEKAAFETAFEFLEPFLKAHSEDKSKTEENDTAHTEE